MPSRQSASRQSASRQSASRPSGRGSKAREELLYGLHPVLEALRARRRVLYRVYLRSDLAPDAEALILAAAAEAGVPMERIDGSKLSDLLGPVGNSQGIALAAGPLPETDLEVLCAQLDGPRRLLALDGVEDPQNLGAIARVAEASGVHGLVLTHRRSPPLSPVVARASAGAIEWLPTARITNLSRAIKLLKQEGFWTVGADPSASETLFDVDDRILDGDLVILLGAEGRGLRPAVLREVDHPLRIPMRGRVESLNVATAAAVLLYELMRRSGAKGSA